MKRIDAINLMALHDRVFIAGRQIGKTASARSVIDAIIEAAKPQRHYGVKVEHSPEFGQILEFECPDCHETLADYMGSSAGRPSSGV